MKDGFKALGVFLSAFILLASCASKKYESQLTGIQNQITYLTESYNKLSMNLNEIQDTLLVVQTRVDLLKNSTVTNKSTRSKRKIVKVNKAKKDMNLVENKNTQDTDVTARKEEIPVFELGASSKGIQGEPGEIFTLKDGGEGYIKIEGTTGTKSIKRVTEQAEKSVIASKKDDLTITPKGIYDEAFKAYSKRKFDKAIKRFSDFLKIFPEHNLSDNAVYWIGESYVGMGEYALALPEFQRVPMKYPNGNKVPDSLLMMGICFDQLKSKENAKDSWKKLVMLFPDTMAAKKAKQKLESFE